jgi:acetylornithine deacetylase/succinyl-diaminopimelate desuccinylase-like protein
LQKSLQISSDLVFRTQSDEGGDYGVAGVDQRAEILDILLHLDVVFTGKLKGWGRDPFDPVE